MNRVTAARRAGLPALILIPIVAFFAFTSFLQPAPEKHERAALQAALAYLDSLPADASSFLFPNNQPDVQAVALDDAGREALETLQSLRPARYRPARFKRADLTLLVLPGFLGMTDAQRKALLTDQGVPADLAETLSPLPASHPPCSAFLGENEGWAWGGFVLVDPQAGAMSRDALRSCLVAGFDYLLGVPTGGVFNAETFPDAAASLVLLDYLRQCSHAGQTDRRPPRRNNRGVTTLPRFPASARGSPAL